MEVSIVVVSTVVSPYHRKHRNNICTGRGRRGLSDLKSQFQGGVSDGIDGRKLGKSDLGEECDAILYSVCECVDT